MLCLLVSLFLLPSASAFSPRLRKKAIQTPPTTQLRIASSLPAPQLLDAPRDEAAQPKVGVLLLNLGGPENGADVEGTIGCY